MSILRSPPPLPDNSYDPDVGAKTLAIDVLEINNVKCLTFKDDGGGLDLDLLHKMLRLKIEQLWHWFDIISVKRRKKQQRNNEVMQSKVVVVEEWMTNDHKIIDIM